MEEFWLCVFAVWGACLFVCVGRDSVESMYVIIMALLV